MVRFRDATAIAIALIILFSGVPFVFEDTSEAAAQNNGVLFYEIYVGNEKGFSLKNYGSSTVDLSGWTYSDGEGTIKINNGIKLPSGDTAVFVDKDTGSWFCDEVAGRDVYLNSNQTKVSGTLNMSKSDEDLYLYNSSGTLVDAVGYGDKVPSKGWSGDAAYINSLGGIIRVESTDSNTKFDWTIYFEDSTSLPYDKTTAVNANVKPFTFPDSCGKPVLEALMGATESVQISIYMITSGYVVSALTDLAKNGVDVDVLLENKPLGYENDVTLLRNITAEGGDVRFIGYGDDARYSYVHNKYAIIDGDEVVITSENWTVDNISKDEGNRGWGAVIYGKAFADKMSVFFDNDFNSSVDIITLEEKTKKDKLSTTTKSIPSVEIVEEYIDSISYNPATVKNVPVSIYMSPDNTYKALQTLISEAEERVYTEQMSLGAEWKDLSVESPLNSMIEVSKSGVDARFMIESSDFTSVVNELNSKTNVKAAVMKGGDYATMHNKGVIIDDTVWVSSVNWTPNSFLNNRECGLYIQSAEVTNFYLSEYMEDWNNSYSSTSIDVTFDKSNNTFTADATGPLTWQIEMMSGDKTTETTESNKLVLDSVAGVKAVYVTDSNNGSGKFFVDQDESNPGGSGDSGSSDTPSSTDEELTEFEIPEGTGLIAIIIAIIAVILGIIKKIKK